MKKITLLIILAFTLVGCKISQYELDQILYSIDFHNHSDGSNNKASIIDYKTREKIYSIDFHNHSDDSNNKAYISKY